ncbi:ATP-binding protein [Shimia sp. MIT910701]|uniref:PAS domain-containing hybrid sensor histidine kinase/response regulator n=1 Tax=Shimia sp. MIT910701 TaxID=3096987 RepID=UPI0039995E96
MSRLPTSAFAVGTNTPLRQIRPLSVLGLILTTLIAVLLVFAFVTASQVFTNLRNIKLLASNDLEWSLAQIELETRDFAGALEAARLAPEPDLDRLRLRFDILYSRVGTMATAPAYLRLTVMPEFDAALKRVNTFMSEAVDLIDLPDEELLEALPLLSVQSAHLRSDARALSLSGISLYARENDAARQRITNTLYRLATIALLLITAVVGLLINLLYANRVARQKERAVSQANRRMSTILTTSMDGVLVVDSTGAVLEFNKASEAIFGYRYEDIRGKNIQDLIAPPDLRDSHYRAMERILTGQDRHAAGKGRVRMDAKRADGTIFPIEIAIEMAEDNDEKILIGFLHDISDRVSAEKELLETRDRALAGERAKAEFLAVMSHEIRTPLNGILGNLSLLNDTALSPIQTRYVRNMEISGRVLMRHVDTVLDITRFEAGKLDVTIACTDLSKLLQELVDSQLSAANRHGTTLSWRWEGPARAWVRTDRAALEQVLLNLVGNAIKFTDNGTITIEAEALPEAINGHPAVELRVSDTGIGISEDRLPKVFDDFVTNDPTLGRVPGGTGLGLGIARRIVTALGGEIGVESTPDVGSTFWVRLPMEEGRQPPAPKDSEPEPELAHLHMLVVEDNEINRELAQELLQREGHWVTLASNGADGVQLAQVKQFDMILMDIAMPVMDGLAATKQIRAGDGPNKDTPIVAVSANILPEDRDRFLAAGMSAFLAKPIDRASLQQMLQDNFASAQASPPVTPTRAGLPEDTYKRLQARFLEEGDALLAAVTAPYRDAQDVAKRCHDLSGAAAIFSAHALHDILAQADTAAKQGNKRLFEELVTQIPTLWRATRTDLNAPDAAE